MNRELRGVRSEVVDVTSVSWALSTTAGTYPPIGIFCNEASTITAALIHDTTETAWILPVGFTPFAFRSINTSSTTKTGMKIIYGQ